jgi:hypothetical protein
MRQLFAALLLMTALPAAAQPTFCGARDEIVRLLRDRYGEIRRGAGLRDVNALFEIFASTATGTWTLLVTRPDGQSCAIAAGEAWREDAGEAVAKPEA